MEKVEVLSPVGDKAGFFESIRSGADAVYMGLPKFNARMKAENITLEDLPNLIRYAHLKNVKVYITMNTILKNSEISQAVAMAGDCLNAGVDAFIVQDLGLISSLKNAYPDIILHGSTQLGVHNVLSAQVAKDLGLTRVVLSRECTINDIAEIKKNVDIELEVFVQGANCVCFSGNCYLSSIKCGASGNRGECKQLCRLPYTLSDGKKSVRGYTLSPRDNCLLNNLQELISIGVSSLKIEGRLRNIGYIKVATSVYRQAVDGIYAGERVDIASAKSCLKRVFARGEYVSGYNDGNNIIDVDNNNHLGVKIGKVKSVIPFKDIYKICIQNDRSAQGQNLHSGDGLKFKNGNNIVSLGVGNVDIKDNNIYVYGKNRVDIDSDVYLSKDTNLENEVLDLSKYRPLEITAKVIAGEKICVNFRSGNTSCEYIGDIVEKAMKKAISVETIAEQLSRVDREIFATPTCEIDSREGFVSLSYLNEIRRQLSDKLMNKLVQRDELSAKEILGDNSENVVSNSCKTKGNDYAIQDISFKQDFDNNQDLVFVPSLVGIVDENCDIGSLPKDFDCLILSPNVYSQDVIKKFYDKYQKYYKAPLLVSLPMIARSGDIEIVEDIVSACQNMNVIWVANNIYGLYFARSHRVWAGAGLNIINNASAKCVRDLGAEEIIGSYEKWTNRCEGTYKISNFPLMTITSCPTKVLYKNDCANCKYLPFVKYTGDTFGLKVRRIKIKNCYFELIDDKYSASGIKNGANVIDCRF